MNTSLRRTYPQFIEPVPQVSFLGRFRIQMLKLAGRAMDGPVILKMK